MSTENQFIPQENNGEVIYKGHTFYVLHPNSGKTIEDLIGYSAIFIHAAHSTYASFTIQRMRSYKDARMYLKPMFFLQPSSDSGKYINTLVDGSIFNLNQLDSILPRIEDILTRTNQLKNHTSSTYEASIITKFLTLAYTRGRKYIEPIPYIFSGINYAYPGISCNFEHTEENKVFTILDIAEKEGLIQGEFYDKTHYCNKCNHGALNFRSVCPKCASSNSETQDIIHHFPCGNVGPMSDFQNEVNDHLNCPKCNKQLRHIGVDYDKPSILHTCMKCDHKFQDFEVKAKCLNCEFDNELEELIEKEIKRYSITNKGENATIFGYLPSNKEMEEIPGTVRYSLFSTMVKSEIERIRIIQSHSNLAMIYLHNSGELVSKIGGDRRRIIIKEVVSTVAQFLRPYDIISYKNPSLMMVTMYDISQENGLLLLEEIVELLRKLLENNVKDFEVKIEHKIQSISTKIPYKEQVGTLIQGFD